MLPGSCMKRCHNPFKLRCMGGAHLHQFKPLVNKKPSLLALLLYHITHPGLGPELTAAGAGPDAQGFAAVHQAWSPHPCLPPRWRPDRRTLEGCDPWVPLTPPQPVPLPSFLWITQVLSVLGKVLCKLTFQFLPKRETVLGVPKPTLRFGNSLGLTGLGQAVIFMLVVFHSENIH